MVRSTKDVLRRDGIEVLAASWLLASTVSGGLHEVLMQRDDRIGLVHYRGCIISL